jgi:hypothetical protein
MNNVTEKEEITAYRVLRMFGKFDKTAVFKFGRGFEVHQFDAAATTLECLGLADKKTSISCVMTEKGRALFLKMKS